MDIKYKPPRPPPILPKRNSDDALTSPSLTSIKSPNYIASSSFDSASLSPPPQRRESNAQRPNRAPPPPPEGPTPPPVDYNNNNKDYITSDSGPVVAPPRKFYPKSPDSSMTEKDLKKELSLVLKKQSVTLPPGFVDIQLPKVCIDFELNQILKDKSRSYTPESC